MVPQPIWVEMAQGEVVQTKQMQDAMQGMLVGHMSISNFIEVPEFKIGRSHVPFELKVSRVQSGVFVAEIDDEVHAVLLNELPNDMPIFLIELSPDGRYEPEQTLESQPSYEFLHFKDGIVDMKVVEILRGIFKAFQNRYEDKPIAKPIEVRNQSPSTSHIRSSSQR